MPENVDLVELSPLRAATLLWRPQQAAAVLTVICKGTFELKSGMAPLAAVQDDVNERDLHKENNPKLGLHSSCDIAPYKTRADVTLVGKAYSPPNELSRSLVARICVGTVDKRVEVHAPRFITSSGRLIDDKFFSKMSLGYERAPGGPSTDNPVGRSLSARPDSNGRVALPNLQRPGEMISHDQPLTPIGFGPIPPNWPSRQALCNGAIDAWRGDDWLAREVPHDWNWSYFNVAPVDQQLAELRPDERIRLEHLHPEEAILETQLPGCMPAVFVQRGDGAQRLSMKGDTLWIDTNRLVHTVTWRGQLTLDDPAEKLRVLVAMGQPGADVSWDEAWLLAEQQERERHTRRHKTAAQSPASRTPVSKKNLTSPVSLVPASDHTPGWMPSPSSPGIAPHTPRPASDASPDSALVVELPLTDRETNMLRELCHAMGYDAVEMLRHALREAHQARFG
jgi:hypothetical protein